MSVNIQHVQNPYFDGYRCCYLNRYALESEQQFSQIGEGLWIKINYKILKMQGVGG